MYNNLNVENIIARVMNNMNTDLIGSEIEEIIHREINEELPDTYKEMSSNEKAKLLNDIERNVSYEMCSINKKIAYFILAFLICQLFISPIFINLTGVTSIIAIIAIILIVIVIYQNHKDFKRLYFIKNTIVFMKEIV